MTELEVAQRVARGEGPNPIRCFNSWLASLRISGTGARWRPAYGEYVYRDPAVWLSTEMQMRCRGLPIVAGHPDAGLLNAETFGGSVVGIVVLTFIRGDELWGIGRFFDGDLARKITADDGRWIVDTSPSVAFGSDTTARLEMEKDGEVLLVEGTPSLVDHLALVISEGAPGGVWSQGGKSGIDKSETKEFENV